MRAWRRSWGSATGFRCSCAGSRGGAESPMSRTGGKPAAPCHGCELPQSFLCGWGGEACSHTLPVAPVEIGRIRGSGVDMLRIKTGMIFVLYLDRRCRGPEPFRPIFPPNRDVAQAAFLLTCRAESAIYPRPAGRMSVAGALFLNLTPQTGALSEGGGRPREHLRRRGRRTRQNKEEANVRSSQDGRQAIPGPGR